jgi:hypothetical protein
VCKLGTSIKATTSTTNSGSICNGWLAPINNGSCHPRLNRLHHCFLSLPLSFGVMVWVLYDLVLCGVLGSLCS